MLEAPMKEVNVFDSNLVQARLGHGVDIDSGLSMVKPWLEDSSVWITLAIDDKTAIGNFLLVGVWQMAGRDYLVLQEGYSWQTPAQMDFPVVLRVASRCRLESVSDEELTDLKKQQLIFASHSLIPIFSSVFKEPILERASVSYDLTELRMRQFSNELRYHSFASSEGSVFSISTQWSEEDSVYIRVESLSQFVGDFSVERFHRCKGKTYALCSYPPPVQIEELVPTKIIFQLLSPRTLRLPSDEDFVSAGTELAMAYHMKSPQLISERAKYLGEILSFREVQSKLM